MELNGEPVVFLMAQRTRIVLQGSKAVVALAIAAACAGLGACANLPDGPFAPPPVDVRSPLAEDIKKMGPESTVYPAFLSIPAQPTDVRPVTAWQRNIFDTLRTRRELQTQAVVFPQTLYGAEAFAKDNKAKAAPPITPEQAAATAEKTKSFAKEQKARAKAPSSAQ
jgi:hypothetical protein